jgi:hypothetical protein
MTPQPPIARRGTWRVPTSLALLALLAATALGAGTAIRFGDGLAASGITFIHSDGSSGRRHIVETVTCGLGLIDYNGDGYPDILFLTGAPLPGAAPSERVPTNQLYRNNRDGTFTDVTAVSGIGLPGYAMGCAVADYDNDGHEDIFITNYGAHRLLRNQGDGTFVDVTLKAGLQGASFGATCVGAGCAFLDYDADGHLDLFVGNYLEFDAAQATPCVQANVPVYCSPRVYPAVANRLYRNRGDGTFQDTSDASGISRYRSYAMGLVCSDFDGDGWTDIYVGNDVNENFLFHNRRDGTFREIGLPAGVAYDQYGDPQGTMGANAGDYDGDGRFDLIVTDYQNQVNTLYRNLGVHHGLPLFEDVTVVTGVGTGSRPLVTWGCGFVDFDNDGVRELFTAAGHLQDSVEQYDQSTTYHQRSLLLQQQGKRFVDVTEECGEALNRRQSSRGAVFGDLQNDGKIDIVVLNARAKPSLLINETPDLHHWALLKLVGTRANRSAVGAVVRLTAGSRTQTDEVRAGRGYQSAEDLRLHFGLGTNTLIERLVIRWPGGREQTHTNLPVDRVLRITEAEAVAVQ